MARRLLHARVAKAKAKGTPADVLRGHAPEVVAACEALRALVKETVPNVEERAAMGWGVITYHAPAAGYFAGIYPRKDHARLLFEHGALLPVLGVLEGETRRMRHVAVRDAEELARKKDAIVRLLRLAGVR